MDLSKIRFAGMKKVYKRKPDNIVTHHPETLRNNKAHTLGMGSGCY